MSRLLRRPAYRTNPPKAGPPTREEIYAAIEAYLDWRQNPTSPRFKSYTSQNRLLGISEALPEAVEDAIHNALDEIVESLAYFSERS